jgi:hypothetical protein
MFGVTLTSNMKKIANIPHLLNIIFPLSERCLHFPKLACDLKHNSQYNLLFFLTEKMILPKKFSTLFHNKYIYKFHGNITFKQVDAADS